MIGHIWLLLDSKSFKSTDVLLGLAETSSALVALAHPYNYSEDFELQQACRQLYNALLQPIVLSSESGWSSYSDWEDQIMKCAV
jgi:hypothetical protein